MNLKSQMNLTAKKIMLLLALLFSVTALAYPQEPPPSSEVVKINTDLVVLDAQVLRKKDGQAISSLRREDFVLAEDGARQEIVHFSQDRLPLSILLLLDLSASVRPVIEEIRNGALQSLDHLRPEDEVALMTFADKTRLLQDFTRDRKVIVEQVSRTLEKSFVGVGTSIHIALNDAVLQMDKAHDKLSRRVIVVVTDNIATMHSFTNPTIAEVNERLLEHSTTVCGLVIGGESSKTLKMFMRGRAEKYNWAVHVDDFSEPTGGEVMTSETATVNQRLAELISRLRIRYSIGYTPTNSARDGKFRKVSLSVTVEAAKREGEIRIKTRQGYFAREHQTITKPN
ncbi:MAG: VWA domain-containing protein [Blastocatellia bacterium]